MENELPKAGIKQQIRLRRTAFAIVGALILNIACFLLYLDGLFRMTGNQLLLASGIFWLVNLSFLYILHSKMNLNFKDPSLTFAQIFWAISTTLIACYFTNEFRSALLMLVLLAFIFGQFKLGKNALFFLVIYSILAYGGIVILLINTPGVFVSFSGELVVWIIFSLVMLIFLIISLEMLSLRRHLHEKASNLNSALEQASADSLTDQLTGIRNRRYIMNVLDRLRFLTTQEGKYFFSVFLIDVDYFKKINDTYGHQVGNMVLQRIALTIKNSIRKIDYFGRIGGEEFLILASYTNAEQAKFTAERICKAVEKIDFSDLNSQITITLSIGITVYQWPESCESVLERADSALYKAKEGGRNQVVVV